ncbi:collagen alpha-6(VI) chain-like [Scyliorhinus torazame]|uniref:collagen alpha-6(VI) chain-like n=1 Tax=Scyliorhinus torazame TaxID=75743 RepID=UPI003B59BAEB
MVGENFEDSARIGALPTGNGFGIIMDALLFIVPQIDSMVGENFEASARIGSLATGNGFGNIMDALLFIFPQIDSMVGENFEASARIGSLATGNGFGNIMDALLFIFPVCVDWSQIYHQCRRRRLVTTVLSPQDCDNCCVPFNARSLAYFSQAVTLKQIDSMVGENFEASARIGSLATGNGFGNIMDALLFIFPEPGILQPSSHIERSHEKAFHLDNFDTLKDLEQWISFEAHSPNAGSNPEVADIIFLIDGSSSIRSQDFEKVKSAIETFINKNEFGKTRVQIGVIQFSTKPRLEFQLDQYDDKAQIDSMVGENFEASARIGSLATGNGFGNIMDALLFIFPEPGILQPSSHIERSHEKAFHLDNFDTLKDLEQWISFEAHSPNAGSNPEVADIIFLIDGSSSIRSQDFEKVKSAIETFINKNEFGKTRVQIGVIQFSTKPRLEFQLDQYDDKAQIDSMVGENFEASARIGSLATGNGFGNIMDALLFIFPEPGILQPSSHIERSHEKAFHLDNFDTLKDLEQWISFEAHSPNAGSNPEVADIIFLIDGSSSIRSQDFEKVKSAIETFINKNEFGKTRVQIGVIQFSTKPRLEFQLDQYDDKAVLLKAVHQIQQLHGGTNTGQALNFTIDYFDSSKGGRPGIQQYLILITDGESGDHVSEAARAIRDRGLNVFAIGIGSANHAELVTISGSHEKAFHLDNFDTLKDLEKWISFEARSPNAGSNPEVADIIFLIDGSSSIHSQNFEQVKDAIVTFINKNEFGKTRVQIGIIQFSTKPRLEFQLDQYDDKAVLLKAVHQIQQLHGGTNTGQALNFTIDYFDSSKGGRPGIQQYLILITDGESGDHVSEAARAIRDRGLNVFAIGIGSANHAELVTISGSHEKAFHLDNFDTLNLEQWISFEAHSPNGSHENTFHLDNFDTLKDLEKWISFEAHSPNDCDNCCVPFNARSLAYFSQAVTLKQIDSMVGENFEASARIGSLATGNGFGNIMDALLFIFPQIDSMVGENFEASARIGSLATGNGFGNIMDALLFIFPQIDSMVGENFEASARIGSLATGNGFGNIMDALLFIFPEPGILQPSSHIETGSNPEVADIIFLIDGSSSIHSQNFEQVKEAIISFINKNEFGKTRVQIGIIQFSTKPRLEFQLDQYDDKAVLLKAVHQIQQLHGGTNTGQALNFTIDYFDSSKGGRPGIQQYLILITDGESGDHVSEAARAIRDRGLNVFAIGIGSANHAELVTISGSHEKAFHLDNFDTLKDLEQWISFEAHSPNGSHENTFHLDNFDTLKDLEKWISFEAHSPNAGSNPEEADIIFLIDGSSSIHSQNFEQVKEAIISFINKNEFGKTRVQIGVIQFSTKPRLEFQLDQYDDKAVLLKAVHQIQQLHGGTNTGQALNFTIDYFDSSKGGRPGIQQYLILITDGESGDHVSEAARAIRDRGLNVFAIGIGSANHAELVTISGSHEKAFHLDNFDTLKDLEKWISFEARSPNAGSNPEVADIIFLIDGSSSIHSQNFEQVKDAIVTFINKNEFGKTRVQIGIIQFSTKPRLEFQLDQYDDKAVLLKAVHQIQQLHGGTNTGQALNFTIDYFDSSKGGRPGIQQYLILITDGESGDHVSEAARAIRDRGLNVFAIGIGSANHAELVTISGSHEKAFHLDNFDTLNLEQWISFEAHSPNGELNKFEYYFLN